jgi:lauroyl/myristoyl acyltransferase
MTNRDATWYRHGFNTDVSWRLILAIMPRVPRPLRPALHVSFTLIFFLVLGDERRAARRNLERVTGRRGTSSLLLTYRLFYNFSRFLVAYTSMPPYARAGETPRGTPEGRDRALASIRAALAEGRGLILAGMHLGQWDVALVLLARLGVPVTVVMRKEEEEAARHAAAVRAAAGVRVVHPGETAWLGVELLAALRRNEIVALQADRLYGDRAATVTLFGAETAIPAGPWDLAAVSGAPILTAVAVFDGSDGYRLECGEAIAAQERKAPGIARLAAAMESLIARYPDQWFNFYDVWAPGGASSLPEVRAGTSPVASLTESRRA